MDDFKMKIKIAQYIKMQKYDYPGALREIKNGKKTGHWIWYVFPQITGLEQSCMCQQYDIQNIEEAKEYLKNETLRNHLYDLCCILLTKHKDKNIKDIMNIDDIKLLSCMTLFNIADEKKIRKGIFKKIIDTFYNGEEDKLTIDILEKQKKEKLEKEKLNKKK